MFISYNDYIHSDEWKKKREEVFAKYGRRCGICQSVNGIEVHHLTYDRIGEEMVSDLMPLCRDCHAKITAALQEARNKVDEFMNGDDFKSALEQCDLIMDSVITKLSYSVAAILINVVKDNKVKRLNTLSASFRDLIQYHRDGRWRRHLFKGAPYFSHIIHQLRNGKEEHTADERVEVEKTEPLEQIKINLGEEGIQEIKRLVAQGDIGKVVRLFTKIGLNAEPLYPVI